MDHTALRQYLGDAITFAQDSRTESARHTAEMARITELYPGVEYAINLPDSDPNPAIDAIFKITKRDALLKVGDTKDPYLAAMTANDALYSENMAAIATRFSSDTPTKSDAEMAAGLNAPAGLTATLATPDEQSILALNRRILESILNSSDASIRSKWIPFIGVLGSLYPDAVKDGLIQQADVDALYLKQNASLAESWYGAGFIVTEQMIGEARNGQ